MLKVNAVFSEKIWGGSKLREYGFDIPSNKTGEAWIISSYKGNSSKLDNGETLRTFYKNNRNLFNNFPSDEFPLLVKILDANKSLSIQVHPNDKKAQELEGYPFGKTECWYILDAKNNAEIIIDINATSKKEAKKLIDQNGWEKLLIKHKIKKGDLFDIKSGTVHAILEGTVVYELQQSSDITYRLYDFERKDNEGNFRELHIDKSLDSIDYDIKNYKKEIELKFKKDNIIINNMIANNIYTLQEWKINGNTKLSFDKNKKNFLLLTVIEGKVVINGKILKQYESGILTSNELSNIFIEGKARILVGNPNKI